MMKIAEWLAKSTTILQTAGIDSARLDSLILLENVLSYSRVDILTRQDDVIPDKALRLLDNYLSRRLKREPIAYIIGKKDFYGREFNVTNDVLIPRPESETIIDKVLALHLSKDARIVDVGTGSGVLAITLALELPNVQVHAIDVDKSALEIAKKNNHLLQGNVHFFQGDLLESVRLKYDVIVANLPYVSDTQYVSPETVYEPRLALYADDDGLYLIKKLLAQIQTQRLLENSGYLLLESEPRQHDAIQRYAKNCDFRLVNTHGFIQLFQLIE